MRITTIIILVLISLIPVTARSQAIDLLSVDGSDTGSGTVSSTAHPRTGDETAIRWCLRLLQRLDGGLERIGRGMYHRVDTLSSQPGPFGEFCLVETYQSDLVTASRALSSFATLIEDSGLLQVSARLPLIIHCGLVENGRTGTYDVVTDRREVLEKLGVRLELCLNDVWATKKRLEKRLTENNPLSTVDEDLAKGNARQAYSAYQALLRNLKLLEADLDTIRPTIVSAVASPLSSRPQAHGSDAPTARPYVMQSDLWNHPFSKRVRMNQAMAIVIAMDLERLAPLVKSLDAIDTTFLRLLKELTTGYLFRNMTDATMALRPTDSRREHDRIGLDFLERFDTGLSGVRSLRYALESLVQRPTH